MGPNIDQMADDDKGFLTNSRAYAQILFDRNRRKAQSSQLATPTSHARSLSTLSAASSVSRRSSMTTNSIRFDQSRIFIPASAYASRHAPYEQHPSASYMPSTASRSPCSGPYSPKIYLEPLTCMTDEMIYDRVYLLLRNNLAEWWTQNTDALNHLTRRMSDYIIRNGQCGAFGPNGLQSLTQIFIGIGHEDIYHYMCLAVDPCFGDVQVFLKGELREHKGKNPFFDHTVMALCREGFERQAAKVYEHIVVNTH